MTDIAFSSKEPGSSDPAPYTFGAPHSPLAFRAIASPTPWADTAVFLHGLGGWTNNWAGLIDRLYTSVHCVAVDLPGFGHSAPPPDGDLSVQGHTRAVIEYLDAAAFGRVHLVGNSLGGTIAIKIAAQRPDLVRTLTLISPVLPALPSAVAMKIALLALPGAARIRARIRAGQDLNRQLDDLYKLIYHQPDVVGSAQRAVEAEETERRSALPYATSVFAGTVRGLIRIHLERGGTALWRQVHRITVPTLLIYGRNDRIVPYRTAHRAYRAFRDARFLCFLDAGHVAMEEHPSRVAHAFRALLADSARAARHHPPDDLQLAHATVG